MYPVRLCLQILPDAFVHVCRWFLVGPVSECLEAFGFLPNDAKQAGFRNRKSCGIHQAYQKIRDFGAVATTAFRLQLLILLYCLHISGYVTSEKFVSASYPELQLIQPTNSILILICLFYFTTAKSRGGLLRLFFV